MSRLAAQRAGLPSRYEVPFAQARAQLESERIPWLADGPQCATSERIGQADGRTFGLRVYCPRQASPERLLVYLHGGGWCVGSPATHDSIVRRLACGLHCEAWSIDYALAPELPYPAGLLDCVAAARLAARSRPGVRLIVAGDSAGANLALDTALRLRGQAVPRIDALLLFYGVYTSDCGDASMAAFGDGRYGLSLQAHRRYLNAYARNASPAYPLDNCADLTGLPPCWFTVAELDILRDQSHEMGRRLRLAGGAVEVQEIAGVIHGFLSYGLGLPQVGEALDAATDWVLGRLPKVR
jgi:acetyl esterase